MDGIPASKIVRIIESHKVLGYSPKYLSLKYGVPIQLVWKMLRAYEQGLTSMHDTTDISAYENNNLTITEEKLKPEL